MKRIIVVKCGSQSSPADRKMLKSWANYFDNLLNDSGRDDITFVIVDQDVEFFELAPIQGDSGLNEVKVEGDPPQININNNGNFGQAHILDEQ